MAVKTEKERENTGRLVTYARHLSIGQKYTTGGGVGFYYHRTFNVHCVSISLSGATAIGAT